MLLLLLSSPLLFPFLLYSFVYILFVQVASLMSVRFSGSLLSAIVCYRLLIVIAQKINFDWLIDKPEGSWKRRRRVSRDEGARIEAPNAPSRMGMGWRYPLPSQLEGRAPWAPQRGSGPSPAENDFDVFWRRQNGSRCNTCRKFCIFPANFQFEA